MSSPLDPLLHEALELFRLKTSATGVVLVDVPGLPIVAVGTPNAPGEACLRYAVEPAGELRVWVPFFGAAEAVEHEWPALHRSIRALLPRSPRPTMRGPAN